MSIKSGVYLRFGTQPLPPTGSRRIASDPSRRPDAFGIAGRSEERTLPRAAERLPPIMDLHSNRPRLFLVHGEPKDTLVRVTSYCLEPPVDPISIVADDPRNARLQFVLALEHFRRRGFVVHLAGVRAREGGRMPAVEAAGPRESTARYAAVEVDKVHRRDGGDNGQSEVEVRHCGVELAAVHVRVQVLELEAVVAGEVGDEDHGFGVEVRLTKAPLDAVVCAVAPGVVFAPLLQGYSGLGQEDGLDSAQERVRKVAVEIDTHCVHGVDCRPLVDDTLGFVVRLLACEKQIGAGELMTCRKSVFLEVCGRHGFVDLYPDLCGQPEKTALRLQKRFVSELLQLLARLWESLLPFSRVGWHDIALDQFQSELTGSSGQSQIQPWGSSCYRSRRVIC